MFRYKIFHRSSSFLSLQATFMMPDNDTWPTALTPTLNAALSLQGAFVQVR